ncbi:DUF1993 family protein [Piscinibacter sp.]|jgi:hypothetical protein|uniref:DUF1993 domain-containing protein n=1 Tax=Piscinibacter sp. TaxID=1903157 RepID=UPI00355A4F93
MKLTMYEASVPVFTRYLGQLAGMVRLAEEFAAQRNIDPQSILQARLSPSMYPFAVQVEIAANFAFRACAPLAGAEVPPFGGHRESFAALTARLAETRAFLATLTPGQMEGSERRQFTSQAGLGSVSLEGPVFLLQYALPNFLFHVTTAYAILRHMGVGLGKADYDGFHVYAAPVKP